MNTGLTTSQTISTESPEKRRSRIVLAPVARSTHPSPRRYGASPRDPALIGNHQTAVTHGTQRLVTDEAHYDWIVLDTDKTFQAAWQIFLKPNLPQLAVKHSTLYGRP